MDAPRYSPLSRAGLWAAVLAGLSGGACQTEPPAPAPAREARLAPDERAAIVEEVRQTVRKDLREALREELTRELRESVRAEIAATAPTIPRAGPLPGKAPGTPPDPATAAAGVRPSIVTEAVDDARPGTSLSQVDGPVRLVELAVGTNVVDRNPKDVRERYPEVPPMLYCYSAVESREPNQAIVHVWRRQGVLVSRVELEVGKSPRWKTWSKQKTQGHWTGPWSCEVTSADGQQLGVTRFIIGR
jgi:hypothetical protein